MALFHNTVSIFTRHRIGLLLLLSLVFLIVMVVPVFADATITQANTVAGTTGAHTVIAVRSDNIPVVAFSNKPGGSDNIYVAVCGDVNCTTMGTPQLIAAASGTTSNPFDMVLRSDNRPLLVYTNVSTPFDLQMASCDNVTCTSVTITTLDAGVAVNGSSIELNSSGFPVIAYKAMESLIQRISVLTCSDTTCTTAPTITDYDVAPDMFTNISPPELKLNSSGIPVVMYVYGIGGTPDLRFLFCANTDCTSGTMKQLGNVTDSAYSSDFALDSDDIPLISIWSNSGALDLSLMVCADAACSSTTTTIVDGYNGYFGGPRNDIELDSSENPVIAYNWNTSGNALKVVRCNDRNCNATPTPPDYSFVDFSVADTQQMPSTSTSMVLHNDNPIIAYDVRTVSGSTYDVKVAVCDEATCFTPSLTSNPANNSTVTIQGTAGNPYVTVINIDNTQLGSGLNVWVDSISADYNIVNVMPARQIVDVGSPTTGLEFTTEYSNGSFPGLSLNVGCTPPKANGTLVLNTNDPLNPTLTYNLQCLTSGFSATNDTLTLSEDAGTTSINVLTNDSGATSVTNIDTTGTQGSVTSASNNVTYSPNGQFEALDDGETATDTFGYTSTDGTNSASATVTVTINGVNDAPVGVTNTYSTAYETTLTVNAPGVLSNDTDADVEALTATLITNVSNGTLTFNANGGFIYIPNAGFSGNDTFTYQASDGTALSNTTDVIIAVASDNTAPAAVNDAYNTAFETALTVNAAAGVLANDTDPDGDTITVALVSGAANGLVALGTDGSFTYTPNDGFSGTDSFVYHASDGTLNSNNATVTITVGIPSASTVAGGLKVGGNLTQGTILPTFSFLLPTDENGNPLASEWFQLVIVREYTPTESETIFYEWYKIPQYCVGVRCSFAPTRAELPFGLVNGDYAWYIFIWDPNRFDLQWSERGEFTINVPAPAQPGGVGAGAGSFNRPAGLTSTLTNTGSIPDGETVFTWNDDLSAAWWHVIILNKSDETVVYDSWYERTEFPCDGEKCNFLIPEDPDNGALENGSYTVYIQSWGAGGFNGGDPNVASEPIEFDLTIGDTAPVSGLTSTFALLNADSGEPTFGWIPAENSQWTLLYLGTNNGNGTYTTRYVSWQKVSDMNCPNGTTATCFVTPQNIFLPNGTFEWWMIGWGPNGFSQSDSGGWIKSPLDVVVAAQAPQLAVPITPTNITSTSDYLTYQWNQVEGISWYQIYIGDAPTVVNGVEDWSGISTYYLEWLHARDICQNGVCSVTPDEIFLPDGNYRWYLQTYNPAWTQANWNIENFGAFTVQRPTSE